ncbi:MAG TPA: HAD family hydrolase [Bacteroidales bacterium]|jgi:histidinol-phosphate phosphatase family protein|nr:HAD family hydrolase [Bacteroidales bacterium]
MKKVVFFDRDGVINSNESYYTYSFKDFRFNDGVVETMVTLQKEGYEFIVVSNQSGIAKKIYTINDVEQLHQQVNKYLNEHTIQILEFYYCTHHPDVSRCICRKPSPLLFEKAIARFDIDVAQSWMIGDQIRDVEAAEAAGIKGILIAPNSDLREVLKIILNHD